MNGYSRTALKMPLNARIIQSSNHIVIYNHFVSKKVDKWDIVLESVSSAVTVAGILKKRLGGKEHQNMAVLISIDLDVDGSGAEKDC